LLNVLCMAVYFINTSTDQSTMGIYHLQATGSSMGLCLIHCALTSSILHAVKIIFFWLVSDKNPEVKFHKLWLHIMYTASLMCYDYRSIV
jgi:hypothetical protein